MNADLNIAQVGGSKIDLEDDDVVLVSTVDRSSEGWLLDSSCSNHMCPDKDCFADLKMINGGTILMGDDRACEKKGTGTVCLQLHDGTIRNLTNVWYVPKLKKKLISLGALEAVGSKILMESEILKVVDGARIVMKGSRHKNLYWLEGKTVLGGAATVKDVGQKKFVWKKKAPIVKQETEEANFVCAPSFVVPLKNVKKKVSFTSNLYGGDGILYGARGYLEPQNM